MLNWFRKLFKLKLFKTGWVNVYLTNDGKYRLSGGGTYKSKKKALKAREFTYSKSRYLGTFKVYLKVDDSFESGKFIDFC